MNVIELGPSVWSFTKFHVQSTMLLMHAMPINCHANSDQCCTYTDVISEYYNLISFSRPFQHISDPIHAFIQMPYPSAICF